MSITITVSNEVAEHLHNLAGSPADSIDEKLRRLLIAEYRRKLTRYHLADEQLRQKYGMSFDLFEQRQMTRKLDYAWDVESDAIAWETAIDGIHTIKRRLAEIAGEGITSDD
jgi:hypothetical protein